MNTKWIAMGMTAAAVWVMAACSGGGGSGLQSRAGPTEGINGGGFWQANGSLSGFGSIVVNGVRYQTTGAAVEVNGQPATDQDLAPGQVLTVRGAIDAGGLSGRADRVVFEHDLRGRIRQIDTSARTVTVLGQSVSVGVDAIFGKSISPGSIAGLGQGDAVFVSGYRDSAGRLSASRIDRDPSPTAAWVRGVVTAVDTAAMRFRIHGLTVDYSVASVVGFARGEPVNGDTVMVHGVENADGTVLLASELLARPDGVGASPDDNVHLEGLVTRRGAAGDFDVAGQRVATGAGTRYPGTNPADVVPDVLVDVQGRVDVNGVLQAVRVEVIPRASIKIEARIDTIDVAAGVVGLLGVTLQTNARTRFEDDDDEPLALAGLRVGDTVEVAAYASSDGLVAARIGRDDDDEGEVEIEGPATDLAPPEFRIGGIRILTDAQTEFDDDLTAAQFFGIAAGRRVEVEGIWTGQVVLAREVELDD